MTGIPAADEARVGAELLGYRIEALVGRGGMGVVYRAHDPRLKRKVALKLLAVELAIDPGFRERFLRESELAASLDHPNVVPIYEAGEADGRLFIAMRYVDGSDLKQRLADGPLEPRAAIELAEQIAGALDAAHASGLVHRDVKPSNVLIAPGAGTHGSDHVYLSDFGLTRRLADSEHATAAEPLMATLDYVAPEQIRGEEVDGRADVYSFGCLLYECLAGEPPFRASSDAALLYAHLEQEPPQLSGRGLPEAIDQVIQCALAKHPDERYQSAKELVEAAREAFGIATPTSSRWWRGPVVLAAGGVALLALVLASYLFARGGPPAALAGGSLVRIDPSANKVVGAVRLGKGPVGVAVGAGRVWVATGGDSAVWAIDPKTLNSVRIPAGGAPTGIAVSGGTIYVAEGIVVGTNVTTFDAASGAREDVIATDGGYAIGGGAAGVWLGTSELERVNAPSGTAPSISERVPIPDPSPLDASHYDFGFEGVAVGRHALWLLGDALDPRLYRIDPRAGRVVATIGLPFAPRAVAVGAGAVWVTAQLDDTVSRVDAAINWIVATIKVGRKPTAVAVGAGAVWVANTIDHTVTRIDPRTDRVTATISVHASPQGIAVGDGSVWVAGDAV